MQRMEVSQLALLALLDVEWTLLVGLTEVAYVSGKQTQWLDYLPSPIITLAATSSFCAVGMIDSCLNVYSPTGRR